MALKNAVRVVIIVVFEGNFRGTLQMVYTYQKDDYPLKRGEIRYIIPHVLSFGILESFLRKKEKVLRK